MATSPQHQPSCLYDISVKSLGSRHVKFIWPEDVSPELADGIIQLMRRVTKVAPIIGFGTDISDSQALTYVAELRENVLAGKSLLLTARDDRGG